MTPSLPIPISTLQDCAQPLKSAELADENTISEAAFWDWNILSKPTSFLPVDENSAQAIRKVIAQKSATKGLAQVVDQMLRSALDSSDKLDIHNSIKESRAKSLCTSKSMRRLFKKHYALDIGNPEWEDRDFAESVMNDITVKARSIMEEQGYPLRALMRFLVDLAPDFTMDKLPVKEIGRPKFRDEAPAIKITKTFRSILIVKDRDLFDLIEDGQYPARKIRREMPIILFIRGTPVGVSALAIQIDGNELNLADWCCFPIDDEDLFLEQMSPKAREDHFYADPVFEDYVSDLITSYDVASEAIIGNAPTDNLIQPSNFDPPAPSPASWTKPVSNILQPNQDPDHIEKQINDRLEPILQQLTAANEHIAQLQAKTDLAALQLAENDQIRALQAELESNRHEFAELLRIAEMEKMEAITESAALRAALRGRISSASETADISEFPVSLSEIEPWANKHLIGRVHILPRAYRTMRKANFNDVERACRALLLLAGPYLDAKRGVEGANNKFIEGLKNLRLIDKCQLTVGGAMRSSEFYIGYNGERLFLDKHIRGKDGRYNDEKLLRIYYHFHAATGQVLIGHMPTHLTTSAS